LNKYVSVNSVISEPTCRIFCIVQWFCVNPYMVEERSQTMVEEMMESISRTVPIHCAAPPSILA